MQDYMERYNQYLFPCVKPYYQEPIMMERGEGKYLYDIHGKQYLDFVGGILVISVGHCNPRVTEKIIEQVNTLQHTSTIYPNKQIIALAEKLAEITPGKLQKSFFTNSGTEADETAVLLAIIATGKQEIIALRNSYSGRSMLAMALTGQHAWRAAGTQILGIKHAHAPYCYRCAFGKSYPDCNLNCAKDIEELILTTTSGEIAAFIAEPIQGVGGYIVPPPEYFQEVFAIIKKYGGLFISDEVQTGFGRTGGKMWGIEHWGVEPDIITFAKGAANGVPIGGTIATAEVADKFTGLSFSTFGGNPVSCVASMATIDVIESENLVEKCRVTGEYLSKKLHELKDRYPVIGEVRGMGLMQAAELVKNNKEPDVETTVKMFEETKKRGLLIGKAGLYHNVIRFAPPLTVEKSDIDAAINILDEAFSAVTGF